MTERGGVRGETAGHVRDERVVLRSSGERLNRGVGRKR